MTAPRRRCSFGLKTMMLGMIILAIPSAWIGYQVNWIRRRQIIRSHAILLLNPDIPNPQPAPSLLWLFGETSWAWVVLPNGTPDAEIDRAQELFPEGIVTAGDPFELEPMDKNEVR